MNGVETDVEKVKLRRVVELNPSPSEIADLPEDRPVSFVPLDGFGVDGEIEYEEERLLGDVIDGYTYFKEGDVAIAKITPSFENGKGAVCEPLNYDIGFGTTEIHILRPSEKIDAQFLWYCLRTKHFRDEARASMRGSAGQQRVPGEFINNYEIPDIPLSQQERIVRYLDSELEVIQEGKQKGKRLKETLDQKRQALTRETVTTGLNESTALKDSEVGWIGAIPEHWNVVRTRFVARLESGHTPSKSNDEYWENTDIPWVSLADSDRLRQNDYIDDTEKHTNEKGLANSSAHILPEETVVMTRDATVGLCSIINRPMAVSQHIVGWVCGPRILPEYLLYVLNSMDQEFDRLTRGSTISTIGMRDIESFKTPLPPIEEQRKIVDHIQTETEQISKLIEKVGETIDLLEEKRQALITATVMGQIDGTKTQNTELEASR